MRAAVPMLLLLLLGCRSVEQADLPEYSWLEPPGRLLLQRHMETVWEFRHGDGASKPFFHLGLTDGTRLTWDRPPDHVWHHAHWFTWKYINGLNYWEEDPQTGKSEGVIEWDEVEVNQREDGSASVSMRVSYHPPGEPELLREERQIEISAPDDEGNYHLDWTMQFTAAGGEVSLDRTPIPGEEDGKPWGGYAGLSLRFAKELTGWQLATPEGPVTREAGVNNWAVKSPLALDFSGVIGGREAGIALLDHPQNLNAPTPWYIVMDEERPFGFTEAALLYYKPARLAAGESFTLRYRVAVHEGRWNAERLGGAQAEFVKEIDEE